MPGFDGPPAAVPLRRLSDEALVARVARSEAAALAELFDRHQASARGVAERVLHDAALAEDAVQDAFLAAWTHADRFAPQRGDPRAWILMLAHHRAVDIVRRRRRRELREVAAAGAEPTDRPPQDAIESVVDRDPVRHALRGLPSTFRTPLALAYYVDLTQEECAQRLREPVGTIKSRTARGLARMRRQLVEPGAA
jgi:RNA polymerase sigma-70 factor (ECF subfamily)